MGEEPANPDPIRISTRQPTASRRSRTTSWRASTASTSAARPSTGSWTSRISSSRRSGCSSRTSTLPTTFRAQYRAFTVDEYQDVNLLQQTLLDLWLGDRDDLCVVGDDYQSIYAFTGAGPEHLLGVPRRFPHATVVRLEENYRSTPQVLALANRLVPNLGGAEKTLRPTRADGPEPSVSPFPSPEDEARAIAERIRTDGTQLERIAILCRTNARLTDFEEALHEAKIPFQGSSLLDRDAARRLTRRLERNGEEAASAVRAAALEAGWLEELPEKLGDRELTRQTDLARLVTLADGFKGDAAAFVADLRDRFDSGGEARGVNLLTLHKAKGPRVRHRLHSAARGEGAPVAPGAHARGDRRGAPPALRRHDARRARPLAQLVGQALALPRRARRRAACAGRHSPVVREKVEWTPVAERLRAWRLERAREDGVPPYVVFHDKVLHEIAATQPRSLGELSQIAGVGPAKLDRYGEDVLALL